ncbi:MAG: cell division protein FtsL [Pyrinomonadaceae bacterium]
MRRVPINQKNYVVHRERDLRVLARLAMLLLCGLFLAGGFVYAAGQHFTAVDYGYKSEKLRRERDQLLEEQHRLLLAREEAASPAQLESAAREIGMQQIQPSQLAQSESVDGAGQQQRVAPALISSSASRLIR